MLEVNSVLAGTYQRVGGVMRVSVQLIDHGAARWGSRYDLQGHDLLRFEDDIAQKVVDELRVQLSGAEQQSLKTASTSSAEAYNLLLQGRAFYADHLMNSQLETLQNAEQAAQRRSTRIPPSSTPMRPWHNSLCLKQSTTRKTRHEILPRQSGPPAKQSALTHNRSRRTWP